MSQKFTVKYELPSKPPPMSRNWVGAARNQPTIQTALKTTSRAGRMRFARLA